MKTRIPVTPIEIQRVLDRAKAEEIAKYVEIRNKKNPDRLTTLHNVCVRFRINQPTAIRVINSVDFMGLSDFAYKPPTGDDDRCALAAAFIPVLWEDAPNGRKLVIVFKESAK